MLLGKPNLSRDPKHGDSKRKNPPWGYNWSRILDYGYSETAGKIVWEAASKVIFLFSISRNSPGIQVEDLIFLFFCFSIFLQKPQGELNSSDAHKRMKMV